ncbi:MAG: hypothetical protein K0B15_16975 [Lentimicrobium sp.]|nr:hypothetical protein [Lentimicrobium sp.]
MKKTISGFLFLAILIVFFLSCSKHSNEPLDTQTQINLKNYIPDVSNEIGSEFGKMVDYSLKDIKNYINDSSYNENDSLELKHVTTESVVSFFTEIWHLNSDKLLEIREKLEEFDNSKYELTQEDFPELSELQLELLQEIVTVAGQYGIKGFTENVNHVLIKTMDLPEEEREIIFTTVSMIDYALKTFSNNFDLSLTKGFWNSFACNLAAGGVGVIYGGVTGVFCPPCGIVVGITVSAGLSAAICPSANS